MTTKFQITISTSNEDDLVIIEGRTRQGLQRKIVKKDDNVNSSVGEAVMSFAPQQT